MTTSLAGQRTPVAIDHGLIRAGSQTAAFDHTQPETLLRNYLRLIRRARSQQRAPEISLRREDVEVLADYLGVPAESVLHRLATLMGSSRTQRNTVIAAFASGALLICLSGSVAATASPPGIPANLQAQGSVAAAGDEVSTDASAVVPESTATSRPTPTVTTVTTVTTGTSRLVDVATPRGSAVVAEDLGNTSELTGPAVPTPTSTASTAAGSTQGRPSSNPPASPGDAGGGEPDVALVAPVVPDATDDVAVGDAVVPPSSPGASDGTADDGSDSSPPPVTTIAVPTDDIPQELPPVNDDTVAVGPPPLPPTTTTAPTTVPTTTVPTTTVPTTTVPTTTVPTTTVPPTTTTTVPTTTVPTTTVPPTTTTAPGEPIP